MKDLHRLTITCMQGLEPLLEQEVTQLVAKDVIVQRRALRCKADYATMVRLNLHCRTALRVLVAVSQFKYRHLDDVYRGVKEVYWHRRFSVDKKLAVRATFGHHDFKNTHYAVLKIKDAVVDQMRDAVGQRPSIDTKQPEVVVHAHLHDGVGHLYLDSSSYSLHRRDNKRRLGPANINETLAAAMYMIADYAGNKIYDPMCGSGTLGMEAAAAHQGLCPQRQRRYFGYQHWSDYQPEVHLEGQKYQSAKASCDLHVLCSDKHGKAVDDAAANIRHARLATHVQVKRLDFFELSPTPGSLIMLNPPYDKRIATENVIDLYRQIGKHLKFNCKGCRCVVISGHLKALQAIGMRPSRRLKVFQGAEPAEIKVFDLY